MSIQIRAHDGDGERWDRFVASCPGGTHLQTTMWAEVKRAAGWTCVRFVAEDGGAAVAGCQVLLRPVSRLGAIAYVPRGPLAAAGREDAGDAVLDAVVRFARDRHMLYVKLQPPEGRDELGPRLRSQGWVASDVTVAPDATVRVDLTVGEEQLRASLRSSMRRDIGVARRRGVEVREGVLEDIPRFGSLVEATARRQGFLAYPAAYYEVMWRAFEPADCVRLLLVEHEGELVAANLVIAFGDTTTCKMGAWSGEHPELCASTLMDWEGMSWARERGHRYYDFDGITRALAERLLAGEETIGQRGGVDHYKLGFGGEVVVFPRTMDRSFHPLSPGIQWLVPRVPRMKRVAQHMQGRRSWSGLESLPRSS